MQSVDEFEIFIASAEDGDASHQSVADALALAKSHRDEAVEDDEAFAEWQHIVVQLEALVDDFAE